MIKIIVFTFTWGTKDLLDRFHDASLDLKLISITSKIESLEEKLRKTRPKVFLIDGELPDDLFLDCVDIIEKSISNFDMDTVTCVFEKDKKPRVRFLSRSLVI